MIKVYDYNPKCLPVIRDNLPLRAPAAIFKNCSTRMSILSMSFHSGLSENHTPERFQMVKKKQGFCVDFMDWIWLVTWRTGFARGNLVSCIDDWWLMSCYVNVKEELIAMCHMPPLSKLKESINPCFFIFLILNSWPGFPSKQNCHASSFFVLPAPFAL